MAVEVRQGAGHGFPRCLAGQVLFFPLALLALRGVGEEGQDGGEPGPIAHAVDAGAERLGEVGGGVAARDVVGGEGGGEGEGVGEGVLGI